MEKSVGSSCDHAEEDYIDMEVASHSSISNHSKCSPPHPREFEFQMFSSSSQRDTITSPADELFCKGKLLPLHHLPPRVEMVEKLLQNPTTCTNKPKNYDEVDVFEESACLFTTMTHTPTSNTPFQSCNISPSESFRVSGELNPDDYFVEQATEEVGIFSSDENSKRFQTRKLKLIKQSALSSKLKASRAFLRSLFAKSSCSSSEASAVTSRIIKKGCVPPASEDSKVSKKDPFGQTQRYGYQSSSSLAKSFNKENEGSFSGSFRTVSTTKSSHSEIENSIQAAIAHCKRSQQQFQTRKNTTDLGFCSLSASRVIYEEQERPELCRDM
ncbi:PREDICTED: probable membrane-associated kinase regulator 4 [Ipomoea nil]|uniref:probable membrane-associated kinase regulator 4 n=1 Tax=Ipomoea nil TaxID=35883 RepID=UPI000900D289|nr:PREDICTED: probable membrane-associated kinase regulator 4 [Ipomoea nil]